MNLKFDIRPLTYKEGILRQNEEFFSTSNFFNKFQFGAFFDCCLIQSNQVYFSCVQHGRGLDPGPAALHYVSCKTRFDILVYVDHKYV